MMLRVATLMFAALIAFSVLAIDTDQAFDDPAMQARYERLIAEVRCVTCQNQNIRDSNAFIAADLRREIRRLMTAGQSDDEIVDFLVERYGDFILYRPRSDGAMALVWWAPAILLLFALIGLLRVVRHRMALPLEDEHPEERNQ